MNWYSTNGTGSQVAAGNRTGDDDAMCGNAVMYDATAGKILVVGGSPNYVYPPAFLGFNPPLAPNPSSHIQQVNTSSTTNAHIITIGTAMTEATVEAISPMTYPRIFANAVILPTGAVFITGGQDYGIPFSDNGSQLQPELWDPVSATFTPVAPQTVPRNYHSVGLLLPDATVFSAGGGLCGACAANHYDGQIYSPGYLFNADGTRATRPVIASADAQVAVGGTLTATTDVPVDAWAMLRLGATTRRFPLPCPYLPHKNTHKIITVKPIKPQALTPHPHTTQTDTVNTDQRRIPLNATASSGENTTYTMTVPDDAGVLIPGYYYLFAMSAGGVPSVASFVSVPISSASS